MGAFPSAQLQPAIGLHRDGGQDFVPGIRTIVGGKPKGTLLKLLLGHERLLRPHTLRDTRPDDRLPRSVKCKG
jgi:hypothetical protein